MKLQQHNTRIIISGGGTGGHIFPAVAIGNALKRIDVNIELLFVGAEGEMEMEKVPAAGFDIVPGIHPIVPIMLYDATLAQEFSEKLLEEGIYVIGFFYPVVPKDQARIRVQISAAHSRKNLDKAIAAFTKIGITAVSPTLCWLVGSSSSHILKPSLISLCLSIAALTS